MHVLVATDHYPPEANGHAVAVAWWARALVEAGVRVSVVAAAREPQPALFEHPGYREVWLAASRALPEGHPLASLWTGATALRALADDPPDVVHLHGYGPVCARVAARYRDVPVVATVHQFPEGAGVRNWLLVHPTMRWALRRLFARAAVALAPSRLAAERLRALTGHPDVRVVPTGVDPAFERAAVADEAADEGGGGAADEGAGAREATVGGAPASAASAPTGTGPGSARTTGTPHVLYVGRRSADKRFETVVALAREHPRADWCALGSGPAPPRVPWPDQLRVLPQAPAVDVAAAMRASDVLIAPSLNETQGLAALEAITVGTPVAAPRGSAQAELLREGVSGALYDPSVPATAWQAILRAAALSRAGVRASAAPYRRDALVAAMRDLYVEVGAGPRSGPPAGLR